MNNQKEDPVMKNNCSTENDRSVDEASEREPEFLDSIPGWSDEQIERYKKLYKNMDNRDRRVE